VLINFSTACGKDFALRHLQSFLRLGGWAQVGVGLRTSESQDSGSGADWYWCWHCGNFRLQIHCGKQPNTGKNSRKIEKK